MAGHLLAARVDGRGRPVERRDEAQHGGVGAGAERGEVRGGERALEVLPAGADAPVGAEHVREGVAVVGGGGVALCVRVCGSWIQ